jgi:hypothetical protein
LKKINNLKLNGQCNQIQTISNLFLKNKHTVSLM